MNDITMPQLLQQITKKYPNIAAQYSKNAQGDFIPLSYTDVFDRVLNFAGGLLSLGITRGDRVGLIADNRKEWYHASMGIMAIGAADVPRGCDATEQDLVRILSFAECTSAVIENRDQFIKILKNQQHFPLLKTLIVFEPIDIQDEELKAKGSLSRFDIYGYNEIIERGTAYRQEHPEAVEQELEKGSDTEVATIIFTSGTTGEPKGVMLTHKNFAVQLDDLKTRVILHPGEKAIVVLPVWHSFERLCEYVILASAAGMVYSKPVGSILLADIAKTNPALFPSVPRIWESVYTGVFKAMKQAGGIKQKLFNFFVAVGLFHAHHARNVRGQNPHFAFYTKITRPIISFIPFLLSAPFYALGNVLVFKKIRTKLGTGFRQGVSGGGALPPNIDAFFWAIGVSVTEGYGLTETAPVVSVRPLGHPVFGTIGKPLSCTKVKIVDDSGNELPAGKLGTVMIRGTSVMKGYYKRQDLTDAVIDKDGWFDSGDLGMKTIDGELILRGRKKDTIVLRGGENIEPVPIEMKLQESPFIAQAVVLGQDQRFLGALIVADEAEVKNYAAEQGISAASFEELLAKPEIKKLFDRQIFSLINHENGFKLFERINRFTLLAKPFEAGVELSAKQDVMRYKITSLYSKQIEALFAD
ncbi:long-chain fatty acid--CoA ligase [Treponema vincentii]|uniref:AMP-dependent synthetase/ligase n=1 Tax=Treponema vincentii TaxID=69710 RepID=UPI003D89E56B